MANTGPFFDTASGISFDADTIADDLFQLDASPDLTPEAPANDVGDLQAAAPLREKPTEEIAYEVEEILLGLLEEDRRSDICVLTGEMPDAANDVDDDVSDEFGDLYTKAVNYNPGIKWYGKLAKMLPSDKFYVSDGQLNIRMNRDLFKRTLLPFIGDFREEHAEESAIVDLVRQMADSAGEAGKEETAAWRQGELKHRAHNEAGQFNPAAMDFSDDTDTDIASMFGQSDLDIEDDIFSNPEQNVSADLDISLKDLSNKAVADYCDDKQMPDDTIAGHLVNEGFEQRRANEVAQIVKYKRVSKANLRSSQPDRAPSSDSEFPFKV